MPYLNLANLKLRVLVTFPFSKLIIYEILLSLVNRWLVLRRLRSGWNSILSLFTTSNSNFHNFVSILDFRDIDFVSEQVSNSTMEVFILCVCIFLIMTRALLCRSYSKVLTNWMKNKCVDKEINKEDLVLLINRCYVLRYTFIVT